MVWILNVFESEPRKKNLRVAPNYSWSTSNN